MAKIATTIYKMHVQQMLLNQLKDQELLLENPNFVVIVRNIFFQEERFEEIAVKDLLEFTEVSNQNMFGDLQGLLGGLNLNELMGALGGNDL